MGADSTAVVPTLASPLGLGTTAAYPWTHGWSGRKHKDRVAEGARSGPWCPASRTRLGPSDPGRLRSSKRLEVMTCAPSAGLASVAASLPFALLLLPNQTLGVGFRSPLCTQVAMRSIHTGVQPGPHMLHVVYTRWPHAQNMRVYRG